MYRIVTGVTSDVGVPSTYLVVFNSPSNQISPCSNSMVYIMPVDELKPQIASSCQGVLGSSKLVITSKVVLTFNYLARSFNLFNYHYAGCVNNHIYFRIWGYVLHVEHVSCAITNCGKHQWVPPSSLSSIVNNSLGLAGGKHYQKINIPVIRFVLKKLICLVAFLIHVFFSIAIYSPYFLLVVLFLQHVALFQSRDR